mmetsp:Transcript_39372/g.57496  ORF Transcript_39372/g.57496 Transcript_39372/m.57496 type:complete len:381 (-) Transcript_39372:253-1395(-)
MIPQPTTTKQRHSNTLLTKSPKCTILVLFLLFCWNVDENVINAFTLPQQHHHTYFSNSFSAETTTADSTKRIVPTTTFSPTILTHPRTIKHTASPPSSSSSTTSLSLHPDATLIAQGLGYLVASGSLLIYTPIAVRVSRQKSADGLTLSTWWLKLASYLCADIYAYTNHYALSTYAETLVITAEATVILCLVAFYQNKMQNTQFWATALLFTSTFTWAGSGAAPMEVIAAGQIASIGLNTFALFPQLKYNYDNQSSGDYSPITSGLAALGCVVRLFTTVQLNHSDPLLLLTYGVALVLNAGLCSQILYYGIVVEGQSLGDALLSDVKSSSSSSSSELTNKPPLPLSSSAEAVATTAPMTTRSAIPTKKSMKQEEVELVRK